MDNSIFNSSRRILVVDDDESIRELCALVLRTAGYRVETAMHGADGLDRLKGSAFDLVITDINMPELDGLEFFKAAVDALPSMRETFLFMTGAATVEQAAALSSMDLPLLEKPFRISDLLEMVEAFMRGPLKMALMHGQGGSRKEGRLSYTDGCGLVLKHSVVSGETLDISPNGVRATYAGEAIPAGEDVTVRVSVNGLSFERSGRAVWTEKHREGFVSGIEFSCPMPVSSIVNIPAHEIPANEA